jgi:hypothetical protein
MAYDIPELEPAAIEAGTSLIFTRDYPDYDPSLWTLTYELVSPTEAPITIVAVEYESEFKVEVAHGVTSTWPAGSYLMSGYVSNATERHLVYRGRIEILPKISGAESFDFRTYNEQMLDLIEEQLKTGIVRESVSYSINGRSFTCKSNTDLLQAWDRFRAEVAKEQNAGKQQKILTRFVKA